MNYELDGTFEEAKAAASRLRMRKIGWDEQEKFFLNHIEEFKDIADLGMVRAMLGEKRFGDNIFWYPRDLLQTMFEEEIADAIVYHIVLTHRRELLGDYVEELGDYQIEETSGWTEEC